MSLLIKILGGIVFGTIGAVFILFHPAGPALVMTAISPFDGLFLVFGTAGNIITFVPLIALMARNSPVLWVQIFAGTPIQIAFVVLLAVFSVSHLIAIEQIGVLALIQYARKATLLLVLGLFAWSMRNSDHLRLMNRVLVGSFAIWATISLLDFYLGIRALPGAADTYGGALGLSAEDSVIHDLRFRGGGLSINATANWLLTPIFVALGWATEPEGRSRTLALSCLAVLIAALFATMSRSAILGFAIGSLLVLPYVSRLRPTQVMITALSGVFAIGLGLLILEQAGFLDALLGRFFPDTMGVEESEFGRMDVFGAGLRVWASSPFIGVGDGTSAMNEHGIGFGTHNAFLGVLAEAGILGIVPFVILIGMIVFRLAKRLPAGANEVYVHWRPFFLAGFVSSMVMSMFNEYPYERMTWYAAAFAVALDAGSARKPQPGAVSEQPVEPSASSHPWLEAATDSDSPDANEPTGSSTDA